HLLSDDDVDQLLSSGIRRVLVAEIVAGDVHEAEAALRVANAVQGGSVRRDEPFTGRVNLYADEDGIFVANERLVTSLNKMHPAVTIATLPNYMPVEEGRMIATIKIIPFAAPEVAVSAAEALGAMVSIHPYQRKNVVLVASTLDSLKPSTMDKTRKVLSERLAKVGAVISDEIRVAHDTVSIRDGLVEASKQNADLIILFGASATVDGDDVGPAGLREAGGELHHFGMPVDPGNLLFLGRLAGSPVIGAPGCARSPVENGFDWVLNRLIANVPVTRDDIMGMGVGGLLMEITSRPQPREGGLGAKEQIAAIVLAAGRSTRMGEANKLLATINGKTLVRSVVETLEGANVDQVIVVTGHEQERIKQELAGMDVRFVHNENYADGLSTSLRTGVNALSDTVDAAMVALADMPFVDREGVDQMIATYRERDDVHAVVATSKGKRGNPVLWSRRFFDELCDVQGDTGARHLIGKHASVIAEVEMGEAASLDLDTPEALDAAGGKL
ncbi:MAG: molybdopterin-binding/glycosyltransferase family 2 protein, partial [Hyphomicrobiales bacterium]